VVFTVDLGPTLDETQIVFGKSPDAGRPDAWVVASPNFPKGSIKVRLVDRRSERLAPRATLADIDLFLSEGNAMMHFTTMIGLTCAYGMGGRFFSIRSSGSLEIAADVDRAEPHARIEWEIQRLFEENLHRFVVEADAENSR
jgi:hypothetical protein